MNDCESPIDKAIREYWDAVDAERARDARLLRQEAPILDLLRRLDLFCDRHPETTDLPTGVAADLGELVVEARRLLDGIEGS